MSKDGRGAKEVSSTALVRDNGIEAGIGERVTSENTDNSKKLPRVIISAEDAKEFKARMVRVKRAGRHMEQSGRMIAEEADAFIRFLDVLKTETE